MGDDLHDCPRRGHGFHESLYCPKCDAEHTRNNHCGRISPHEAHDGCLGYGEN